MRLCIRIRLLEHEAGDEPYHTAHVEWASIRVKTVTGRSPKPAAGRVAATKGGSQHMLGSRFPRKEYSKSDTMKMEIVAMQIVAEPSN